ncbi:MAG TPA: phosphoenolpyruvate carboxykinase (GTP) [Candidatus Omnitrophica bacterium]|nr:phosphoenolpyruvate carboxykinase (GTP) [Candidatus Omnitrophota bacterium]
MTSLDVLKEKCSAENLKKLSGCNEKVLDFIARYAQICNPDTIFIRSDSAEDADYIRKKAIQLGEEHGLNITGHTAHFDGIHDQGRDKESTKFLVTPDFKLEGLNSIDRDEGLKEMEGLLKDAMKEREMYVLFLCLGPVDSEFSVYAVQLTDSAYVGHSEDILYRDGYRVFKSGSSPEFFRYVHSAGELDESKASKNYSKKRIYIDFLQNTVYSANTQYAGNTVGLKKLALRLAIRKADRENWLAEHMFVMALCSEDGENNYFTGAYPSSCGKTSTCMVEGERIVGDDIAYLRKRDGKIYAVNVERGIFGIIRDVNPKDDPLIWGALNREGEVIFSNVLVEGGKPYWQGDGRPAPNKGKNFSGEWYPGKIDEFGNEIPYAHANARYTIRLQDLKNCDSELDNPKGVEIKGIIYGGRDSDTWVPVFESFNWAHGVVAIAASLESETTAATLGKVGERKFNLMANLDFLSIPVGKYIKNHLDFIQGIEKRPVIFGVNYFLCNEHGEYMTGIHDKRVWLKWMQLRVSTKVGAIETPIGYLPKYEDLQRLFKRLLNKDFSQSHYGELFSIRCNQNLDKIERIKNILHGFGEMPKEVFNVLDEQNKRLKDAQAKFGSLILPEKFI